jgi:hypothetical protein
LNLWQAEEEAVRKVEQAVWMANVRDQWPG